jgi:hypothetical protein
MLSQLSSLTDQSGEALKFVNICVHDADAASGGAALSYSVDKYRLRKAELAGRVLVQPQHSRW